MRSCPVLLCGSSISNFVYLKNTLKPGDKNREIASNR